MSSDNILAVIGPKVYDLSASDDRDLAEQIAEARPIYVARSHRKALRWVYEHGGFGDEAYAEYGVGFTSKREVF